MRWLPKDVFAWGTSRRCRSHEITAEVSNWKPVVANFRVKAGMLGEGPMAEIFTGLDLFSWRQTPSIVRSISKRLVVISAMIDCNNSRRVAARNGLPVLVEMMGLSGKIGAFRPGELPIIQSISGRDRWGACTAIAAVVLT